MVVGPEQLALAGIALVAATVNGALGYGFSSITVPLALLFLTNRVLNPALVLIEVVLNAYLLWMNRCSVPNVWRRVLPVVVGLLPGVVVGTLVFAHLSAGWLKLMTYALLLPVILLQAAGRRWPIREERRVGAAFGAGIGLLYALTTVSGPPLAVALNNQGLVKRDFRAGLGVIRLAESSMTSAAYLVAGLFTIESLALVPALVPGILLGAPLGAVVVRHLRAETFRRICMSFDAWIVAIACSRLLIELGVVASPLAYVLIPVVGGVDLLLLMRFFLKDAR